MVVSSTTNSGRPQPPPQDSAGVTLIELMIVLVMISIGILALSGIQTHSSNDVYTVGRRSTGLAVAETQMESKRALGFSQAISDSGVTGIYNWTSVVDSSGPELNRITVTVKWTVNGVADSVKLFNLISNR